MNKILKTYFILLFLVSTSYVLSQEKNDTCGLSISGQLLDKETSEPIYQAKVSIEGRFVSAYSNEEGYYELKDVCSSDSILVVQCLGYHDTTVTNRIGKAHYHTIKLTSEDLVLDSVVVAIDHSRETGNKTLTQDVVRKKSELDHATNTLAKAISEIDGVSIASTGNNVELPVIHGLYGNRVLVINNGVKHGFQNWGTDHAPEIDVANVSKIKVLKGAGGVRYGAESLGGVILTEASPLGFDKDFVANLGAGYETNGKGYFSKLSLEKGYSNFSYNVNGVYKKFGDRHAPDYQLTNTGKEEFGLNAGGRYILSNWDINVYYSYFNQNLALLRSSISSSGDSFERSINSDEPLFIRDFSYDINAPNQLIQHHLGKLQADWWYKDDAKLTFKFSKQVNSREEYDVRRDVEKPIIDLNLFTDDFEIEWKHNEFKKLNGLIGVHYLGQTNENVPGTGTTPFIPNYISRKYGFFVMESLEKNKTTFEFGLRFDHEINKVKGRETNQDLFADQFSFSNLTSSIGLVKNFTDSSTFRSNFGTAWRSPNMAELYSFGQHGFKSTFGLLRHYFNDGNDLKTDQVLNLNDSDVSPEKGFKWINEWVYKRKKSNYIITAYSHYIKNYVFDRPIAVIGTIRGPMPVFIVDQTDAVFLGTDMTWHHQLTKKIQGSLGGSYLWSLNVLKKENLIYEPPASIRYDLSYTKRDFWKFKESKFFINSSYTFRQFQAPRVISPKQLIDREVEINGDSEIFDFKVAPEGYFLLNVGWSYRIGSFEGSIEVNNVLNKRYRNYLNEQRYFADELGTNVLLTINYKFKSKTK